MMVHVSKLLTPRKSCDRRGAGRGGRSPRLALGDDGLLGVGVWGGLALASSKMSS